MLFTHHSDPDRDEDHRVDGDDYDLAYRVQGEIPGVSELAGQDPADDLRRENVELRRLLLRALVHIRADVSTGQVLASQIAEMLGAL